MNCLTARGIRQFIVRIGTGELERCVPGGALYFPRAFLTLHSADMIPCWTAFVWYFADSLNLRIEGQ